MKDKNAKTSMFLDQFIYIIIVTVVFAALLFFVVRAGSNVTIYEQIYSKQIGLSIDKSKPGTNLTFDINELYKISKKNKYEGGIIKIDNVDNKVTVTLVSGKGYSYRLFSDNDVLWELDKTGGKLHLFVI
ncbi:MAG: hypothetical protein WC867_06865 [Candidatus Pacearchaeota archaeon]|jgi:hypothetical protein